jgi:hypothetical protein
MLHPKFEQDEYGEVFNSPDNFKAMAKVLEQHGSLVIGWTDEAGSHLDILLVLQPIQVGVLQGGQSAHWDLFVSVLRTGSGFGFKIDVAEPSHPNYVSEKLQINAGSTTDKLAELVNGVRELL